MADKLQQAGKQAQDGVGEGTKKWEAMSDEQKKTTFDNLPSEQKKGKQTYAEWIAAGYHHQYENWMPWIEDKYLSWFTNHNKTSYATKDTLDKSKITGVEQVDTLQDGVNNLVSGQVGKGGLLQPVGDMVGKEGINRAERGGKDDKGSYGGAAASYTDPAIKNVQAGAQSASDGAQSAGSSIMGGAKSAGSYVGGMFGGKKEEGAEKK